MSKILTGIDPNNYAVQNMVAGEGGGSTEDLTTVLNAQDSALSTQVSKIAQLETALDNKIALDLQEATSDATATASDIADGKTAYVNGVKVEGTAEISDNNAKIDTSKVYAYTRGIESLITKIDESFDTSQMTLFQNLFSGCRNLVTIPVLSMASLINDDYAVSNAFYDCKSLSNESLNNILRTCTTISTKYKGEKTLKKMGLTSAQATTCQSLSNYNDFINAGWTTGY